MMKLAEFIGREHPADIAGQVESVLDFLSEALSALALHPDGLSTRGAEGLAVICTHLGFLCREAANK